MASAQEALEAIRALPGCVSTELMPGASVVSGRLTGFVAEFAPTASVAAQLLQHTIGGTSLYAMQDEALDETTVLATLDALARAVPHETPQPYALGHEERIWRPAMCGPDSYLKVLRSIDPVEHTASWFLSVRSQVPIKPADVSRVFERMTYGQLVGSVEWQQLTHAASRNRNRIAADAVTAIGVSVQTHADSVQTRHVGETVSLAVPYTEVATNTFALDADSGNVIFYGGCTPATEARHGVLLSPSANTEVWVHGSPLTGVNKYGGPFKTPLKNAFPVSTGIVDAKAAPGVRERAAIAKRLRCTGPMDMCRAAVRGRTGAVDPAWFATAVDQLGWEYAWSSTTMETVMGVIGGDDESSMDLATLLDLSDMQDEVVVSTKNPVLSTMLANARAVSYAMSGRGGKTTFASFMEGAETGVVRIPRAALLALSDVLSAS